MDLNKFGEKYFYLFIYGFPRLQKEGYVRLYKRKSIKGLLLLFVTGLLSEYGHKRPILVSDIYSLYLELRRFLLQHYAIDISTDKSNIKKTLAAMVKAGYLVRELVDLPNSEKKAYKYYLSPKGRGIFDLIIKTLDNLEKNREAIGKLYMSKSDKVYLEAAQELDAPLPPPEMFPTYFESEEEYKNLLEWAETDTIIFPPRLSSLSKEVDKYLEMFYTDNGYPFAALYRSSAFVRIDTHYFYSTAGKLTKYLPKLMKLRKLLNKYSKEGDMQKYTRVLFLIQTIYRKLIKKGRGIREISFFLDRDLIDDPVKTWIRASNLTMAVLHDALKSKPDYRQHLNRIKSKVTPVYMILPTDSKFYDTFSKDINLVSNMIDNVFIVEGTPIFVSSPFKIRLGTAYICKEGHVHWALPDEPEPTRCPVCGRSIIESKPVYIDVVAMDIAPPIVEQIFKVLVPVDLLYFIKLNTNIAAGFVKYIAIDVSDYIKDKNDNLTFLVIGYLPFKTKPRINEKDLHKIKNELAKKRTWEILNYFSTYLFNGIIGYDHAKVAAMFIAFSQTTKRIAKSVISTTKIRIDASQYDLNHTPAPLYGLFIGKPGTGKSSIAKDVLFYANPEFGKYAYVNLSRASPAGLTAAAVSAQGSRRKIYIGIERVAHGTMIVYDEADKAKESAVLQSIADTMSEGLFTYDKAYASMLRELAITAKIVVANDHRNLEEEFESFDLLYDYLMNPKNYSKDERAFKGFVSNVIDRFDFIVYFPRLYDTLDLLKKYLEISETIKISQEDLDYVKKIFSHYVALVRNFSNENKFYISKDAIEVLYEYLDYIKEFDHMLYKYLSSPRRLDSLYKLARTIAAMHFRNEITLQDMKEALAFILYTITYPFGERYLSLMESFKEELGIFFEYMKAFVQNTAYYKILSAEEEYKSMKITIRTRTELVRYAKSILSTWQSETISREELYEAILKQVKDGNVVIKPIASWRIQPPIEQALKDEVDKVFTRLEYEGVLLYVGNNKYKINRQLL